MSVAFDALDWQCEECGAAIRGPAVVRMGAIELRWHIECAERVGKALLMDSREACLAADGRPHWRRRAIATVRHRLLTEERSAA